MAKKLINTIIKIGVGVILNGIIEDYSDNFIKLENGLMFQWGTAASENSSTGATVIFSNKYLSPPFTFSQTLWNSVWNYGVTVYEISSQGFKWRGWTGTTGNGLTTPATIQWLSIGKWK